METKANTVIVGAFTLAVLVLLVAFASWFSSGGQESKRATYLVYFDGAVGGLLTGSNVLFNGIKVGEVRKLELNPADPKQVVATISVEETTPVRADTRVSLELVGITGITAVSLRGGEADSPRLTAQDGKPPVLFAEPSMVQDLMQSARQIMGRADTVMEKVDKFVSANQQSLTSSVKNVEDFTQALKNNAGNVDKFLSETSAAGERIAALSQRVETMLGGVDQKRLGTIVENVDTLSANLARDSKDVSAVIADLRKSLQSFDKALLPITDVAQSIDKQKVASIVANVDSFTAALGRNSGNIDSLVKDAAGVADKLNAMADRLDKLTASFAGDGNKSMFNDFSEAARSIKVLAERLDKRTAEMSSAFTGLSDRTTRELQGIATDSRRTLGELDRTLKSLEKNPQRVIFGGSGVPEYNRR